MENRALIVTAGVLIYVLFVVVALFVWMAYLVHH